MALTPPIPEPVPFNEVAEVVLADAVARAGGGPAGLIVASGVHLAAALEAVVWRVVRDAPDTAQLCLW
jgi:hypothetical protein